MKKLLEQLYDKNLTKEKYVELWLKILSPEGKELKNIERIRHIEDVVCRYYNLVPKDLKTKAKKPLIIKAKKVIWYFARKKYGHLVQLQCIGDYYKRNHSTIMRGIKTLNDWMDVDPELLEEVLTIKDSLDSF